VCFTDRKLESPVWDVVVRPEKGDPVRIAKQYKILTHRFFPRAQYFVWNDGSQQLLERITPDLVEQLLDGNQIVVHPHPHRKCIYREARYCLYRKKDRPRLIQRQMDRYRKEGMPKNYGLIRGGFFIRRNNPETNHFFEKWWEEISTGSRRDQLSFDYLRWKIGIKRKYMSRSTILYHHHPHHPGQHIELAIANPRHSVKTLRQLFLARPFRRAQQGVIMSLSEEGDTVGTKQSLLDRASSEYICLMDANFNPKTTEMQFFGMPRALRKGVGMIVPSPDRKRSHGRFSEVQDITGNCFIMRRSLLEQMGGLDVNYQIGFAERDLARRLILKGYRILRCNRSVAPLGRRRYTKKEKIQLQQDEALFNSKRKLW
jgi:hypothetical protein